MASFSDVRCPEKAHTSAYDLTGLQSDVLSQFGVKIDLEELNGLLKQEIEDHIIELLERRFQEKEDLIGPENMREAERVVMLNVIDNQWKDHLLSMDHLKEGIGLRGYGQKDPLIEYKKESFELFQDMMDRIEDETIRYLFFLQVAARDRLQANPATAAARWSARIGPSPCCPSRMKTRKTKKTRDEEALVARQFRAAPGGAKRRRRFHPQHPAQKRQGNGRAAVRRRQRHGHREEAGHLREEGRPQRSLPLRQRQKIQEMPRSLISAVVFVSSAYARPSGRRSLGQYQRQIGWRRLPQRRPGTGGEVRLRSRWSAPITVRSQVTASRFKDVTGAYAASLDPSSKGGIRVGNYLISCEGKCPKNLAQLADAGLPNVSHGSLPTLGTYFPAKSLLPRSERYIMGPVGLKANAPEIPASAVGFDFGTEGEMARYRTPAGPATLAVFSFPLAIHGAPATSRISEDCWCDRQANRAARRGRYRPCQPASAKLLERYQLSRCCGREREAAREAARTEARERRKDGSSDSQPRRLAIGFLLTIRPGRGRNPSACTPVWLFSC